MLSNLNKVLARDAAGVNSAATTTLGKQCAESREGNSDQSTPLRAGRVPHEAKEIRASADPFTALFKVGGIAG